MKTIVYLLALSFLCSCVSTDSKKEPKSKLNYLNGEQYNSDSAINVGGVPVNLKFKQIEKDSTISGEIVVKEGLVFAPLNHQKLILKDLKGKKLVETESKAGGVFMFKYAVPNGKYTIEVDSKKYQGTLSFELKSYEKRISSLLLKQ